MPNLIIVDNAKKIDFKVDNAEFISAKKYLNEYEIKAPTKVYNLCKSYKYQSIGYYVSLLALARAHKVLPSITTIQDLKSASMIKFCNDNLQTDIENSLKKIKSNSFVLSIYFGKNIAKQHNRLCKKIFEIFRAPLLKADFQHKNKTWILKNINVIALNDIPRHHIPYFRDFAQNYFQKKKYDRPYKTNSIYDLAILINSKEKNAPSNIEAIKKFTNAAESIGFNVDLITKEDFRRIPEYDALFIRETTAVNHHTYKFARKAAAEGLVVIDDPSSIIKCTNKVYIAELLKNKNIPTPKTLVINKQNYKSIVEQLGFPCVLKQPDGSFSQGVIKIDNMLMLKHHLDNYFKNSELIIAQEFMRTDFDWRIGILSKKVIFACKYYMAENHWQIYNWNKTDETNNGNYEAINIKNIPKAVMKTALKAANLIGDGFYGVDLKEINNRAYIIEINDNPNIDAGIEDAILGNNLYLEIMQSFLQRIQMQKAK